MAAMLQATNVNVRIGRRVIVNAVDFEALPGQITAIVGPNGSGKSTLLKALCNELPFTGNVTINGHNLKSLLPREAAAMRAVLPQTSRLTFPFTVHEVVRMGLTAGRAGTATSELPARALERVDLANFGSRFYGDLSGGEQQRVQLARVLCQVWEPVLDGKPRYLLLDEPVSSLDIRHQLLVMDIARAFAAAGGGVVAILHDLNLTALYADRVLALRAGRVATFGPPSDVLTSDLLLDVFGCKLRTVDAGGDRFFVPPGRRELIS